MDHFWVPFLTVARREMMRYVRIWSQTLLPSPIMMLLYLLVFGRVVGSRVPEIHAGISYVQHIVPGLVIMAVITNAYSNVVSSFFGAKFQRNIQEMYVSPMSSLAIVAGFLWGGITRGLLVGVLVLAVGSWEGGLRVLHPGMAALVLLETSVLFSAAGLANAVFARKFDDTGVIPTFVLTPLTYLGGVFFSAAMLPAVWQPVVRLNPIFHLVDLFRYSVLGVSEGTVALGVSVVGAVTLILLVWVWWLVDRGIGVRT